MSICLTFAALQVKHIGVCEMRFIAQRIHDGITFYGYAYSTDNTLYWSMQFYRQTWHFPMSAKLLEL
jgi:hypothetical protein